MTLFCRGAILERPMTETAMALSRSTIKKNLNRWSEIVPDARAFRRPPYSLSDLRRSPASVPISPPCIASSVCCTSSTS